MFRGAIFFTWVFTIAGTGNSQLIRPVSIYQNIIQGVHDYFNNTCIILLHATNRPMQSQGLKEGIALQKLQAYLSGRHIRTTTMTFRTFAASVRSTYYEIKRPLFVLLNDSENVKREFAEQVSEWIDMSYPTWLIFFRDETSIDRFFENIYVPFNCKFMIAEGRENDSHEIITEIYQIDRGREIKKSLFATYDPANGLKATRLGLYQRRNNLFGQTIRVTSIHDPPGSLIVRDEDGRMIGLGGFFGGMMQLLQEYMNCTIAYHESVSWGHCLENGTWTGAIGLLTENTVDLVAAELMMTPDRLDAIDFTAPVYTTKCRAYIKRPRTSSLKWRAYVAPFTSGIWSSIGILVVVTSSTISLVKSIARLVPADVGKDGTDPSFFVTLFAVFGTFCSQGMDQSSLDPIRIIHLVIHLTGVVVLAAYSAALISSLATKIFVMPFTTMEGLLKDGTYRFGVIGDSADYSFFQNTTDRVLRVLFEDVLTKELNLPNNYYDGLSRVCGEEKYAFMTLDNVVSQLQPKVPCKLEPLDTIMQSSIGMAVPPQSPYKGIIDANILLIRDSGILQRLLNSEWMLTGNNRASDWTIVEIADVLPLVVLVVIGIMLSFLTLGSEHIASKRKKLLPRKRTLKKKSALPSTIRPNIHNGPAVARLSRL